MSTKPASPVGCVIAFAVLVGVVLVGGPGQRLWSEFRASPEFSAKARARVTRLDEGSCWFVGSRQRCPALHLEVHPAGGAPWEAEVTQALDLQWMSRVQPGNWVVVAVDREDASRVRLDVAALQLPPPEPPAADTPVSLDAGADAGPVDAVVP